MPNKTSIAILGAGSWGTAVAIFLATKGYQTLLWSKNSAHVKEMQKKHRNERYLPQTPFPETLEVHTDLTHCVTQATHVVIAVPSHAFAELLQEIPQPKLGLAWLTKGIDPQSHQLLNELVKQQWGETYPTVVISGPSFAKEVAMGLPTALVVASQHSEYQCQIRDLLHAPNMRVYLSEDINGVQLCGVVKNILAIACGISDGIGYGANAKAALITRGLAEMQRLLHAFHARPETCLSLAGVGDLVLTCTDNQSRNRRFGLLLGEGTESHAAEKSIGQVVEGKYNAAQVSTLAQQHQIDMPICQEVHAVLEGQRSPKEAVALLMNRPPKEE
ncbi:MAG: NAD(P)-dependent glycerol-3-phosphate dehydrogenase [Gammaproteobacteria bacterium]|nr:NAD(P)-dependent glycerol-3-phosphate dehydrogenase [Gammaproteobacteria bacterium]